MTSLIVILDPDYAKRLENAAGVAPVWIVDSEPNRPACERLWESDPHLDYREKGAITCFETSNPEDRLGSLLGILPDLETHHGEMREDEFVFPNGFVLEVVGLALADNVTEALRESGFTSFAETYDGFQACK